jgi:hypothetical protein
LVVVDGETDCEPLSGTAVPFKSALTAFVDVHVRVELLPAVIDVGFAKIPAVGGPFVPTVTTAEAVAVALEELVAIKL